MNRSLFEKEHSAIQHVKWTSLTLGLAMIVLGVSMILFPEKVLALIGLVIGIAALAYGVLRLLIYAILDRRGTLMAGGLFAGIFFVGLGVWALFNQALVVEKLTVVFGMLLLVGCILRIQHAIMMKRLGCANWWLILILGLIGGAFASLLIWSPGFIQNVYMILSGVFLILDGAAACATMIIFQIFLHGYKKAIKEEIEEAAAYDADYEEMDDLRPAGPAAENAGTVTETDPAMQPQSAPPAAPVSQPAPPAAPVSQAAPSAAPSAAPVSQPAPPVAPVSQAAPSVAVVSQAEPPAAPVSALMAEPTIEDLAVDAPYEPLPDEPALEPATHVADGPGDISYTVNPAGISEDLFTPGAAGDIKVKGNESGFDI